MKISLPNRLNHKGEQNLEVQKSLVVIGANGAGKSKFGRAIAEQYKENSILLSALHSLYHLKSKDDQDKQPIESDFDQLMHQLMMDEYMAAIRFKEEFRFNLKNEPDYTKLDKLQQLWSRIMINTRLVVRGSNLEIVTINQQTDSNVTTQPGFQPSRMSEGEKIVFYFICSVLFTRPGGVIIVDEPEMHLHRSVMNSLWDTLEEERTDCIFIYLTNDISFASSRRDSIPIWVKAICNNCSTWDYEVMKTTDAFSQEVYLEILGSRKPILFIEGNDSSSIDIHLYPHIFPEYTVKPLGGCTRVIESTKAINNLESFHLMKARGIVDRDRRTDDEVAYLRHHQIYVPNVAEVENLLLLPHVIKTVAKRKRVNPQQVFDQIVQNLLDHFGREIEEQCMLHVRHRIKRQLELSLDKRTNSINDYENHLREVITNAHPKALYKETLHHFKTMTKNRDYMGILKVYNQKQMLRFTHLFELCNVESINGYLSVIVAALRENQEDANTIRRTIKRSLGIIQ